MKKPIQPLPYPVYFWTVFLLALSGVAVSVYLVISHYRVYTDLTYSSFCAISKAINCDTVSQSAYSILFGVPVSVWGVLGYGLFTSVLFFTYPQDAQKRRGWSILLVMALFFSIYSVILAIISTYYIHSYCLMCIVSYAINFLLLYYVWIVRKRFHAENLLAGIKQDLVYLWRKKKTSLPLLIPILTCMASFPAVFPVYWQLEAPQLSSDVPTGITADGHPWIGAEEPELTIIEYTDYQCFQCKKMHFFLRNIINAHSDKVRLVHRHYPMDHQVNPIVKEPFHTGSGALAMIAIYAASQDKFWPVNDYLFNAAQQLGQIDLRELSKMFALDAKKMAISLKNRKIKNKLMVDIRQGMKIGITGTPGFVIDGQLHLAHIPPDILKAYID